ncbi:MAG: hypothetical protein HY344_04820 [Candidatus Levybacteria bacterium]|nr:hypothetical protein [Candidatus Levybacteria bacterium]
MLYLSLANIPQLVKNFYDNGIYNPNLFLLGIMMIISFILLLILTSSLFLIKTFPRIYRTVFFIYKKIKSGGLRSLTINDFPQKLVNKQGFKKILIVIKLFTESFKKLILFVYDTKLVKVSITVYRSLIHKRLISLWNKSVSFINKDQIFIFIVLLLIVVLTRFSITYSDPGGALILPEKFFHVRVGQDFLVPVFFPTEYMIHGLNPYFDLQISYGPAIYFFFSPFLIFAPQLGICSLSQTTPLISCEQLISQMLIVTTIAGYIIFIFLLAYKKKERVKSILLMVFIIFLLGIPGSFGLERVNMDIIFSLLVGFLLLMIVSRRKTTRPSLALFTYTILIGFMMGFLVNAKLFLAPFALIAIFSSEYALLTFVSFVVSFLGFNYSPHLFGLNITIADTINQTQMWAKFAANLFNEPRYLSINHSFEATASLLTSCVYKHTCAVLDDRVVYRDVVIISAISKAMFILVFIIPFISIFRKTKDFIIDTLNKIRKKNRKVLTDIINNLNYWRLNKALVILLFILADAVINLIPQSSFTYRLYYSLPIILLLWVETRENSKARFYCYISTLALLLKGLWIFTSIDPRGMTLFDPRFMNIFVLIHFYFLIKAGIENMLQNSFFLRDQKQKRAEFNAFAFPVANFVSFLFRKKK